MKRSKSDSGSKRKKRAPGSDGKRKFSKFHVKSNEKDKLTESEIKARKTRWDSEDADQPEKSDDRSASVEKERGLDGSPIVEGPLRIADLLNDRERIVDYLFYTVTGAALEQLIPDYLKNRSLEELKSLCMAGLKEMPDDKILGVISGKETDFPESPEAQKSDTTGGEVPEEENPASSPLPPQSQSPTVCDTVASGQLESGEITEDTKEDEDDGTEVPDEIGEEVAESLHLAESDADLLELEMRARVIRALLNSKAPEELNA